MQSPAPQAKKSRRPNRSAVLQSSVARRRCVVESLESRALLSADPVWSTYLGGSDFDSPYGVAVDAAGNTVVTGDTNSPGWVSGGFDTTYNDLPYPDDFDPFVVKVSPTGEHLWSTYLGGAGNEWGLGVAVDSAGNILVTGQTSSIGWVSGGFDTTYNGGGSDAFVVKLSPTGEHLWSTYLGGNSDDGGRFGNSIAVDADDNVQITGYTYSSGWVSGGFDATLNGVSDAFVVKLSPTGNHLWSTYLGGDGADPGRAIAMDSAGNILVTGLTSSVGWVSGGIDTTYNGGNDVFVAKLSPAGGHLWSTYLGGDGQEEGRAIEVDSADNLLLTGITSSAGWASGGFDTTYNGGDDAFVAKLSPSGGHLWSTYLAGDGGEWGHDIAVDSAGNAMVTGRGGAGSSVWVSGGFDTTPNNSDAFVAQLSPSGGHLWSTYLGGSNGEYGYGIAVDSNDDALVTGFTSSPDWIAGGYDTTYNGGSRDGFVVKIAIDNLPPDPGAPTVDAGPDRTVSVSAAAALDGTVSDDGLPAPLTTTWSQVSGPGTVTFGNAGAVDTTASFSKSGTYLLKLEATDTQFTTADYVSVVVNPLTADLTAVADTYIDGGGGNTSKNFGTLSTVVMDGNPDDAALLRWNLSGIPAGSTLYSAALSVNVTGTSADTYEIYELKRSWSEVQATWSKAATGSNYQTAGAQGANDRGTTVLGTISASATGVRSVVLNAAGVAVVQGWVNNPATNFGFIIQDYANATKDDLVLSSREASVAANRPRLILSYDPPAPVSMAMAAASVTAGSLAADAPVASPESRLLSAPSAAARPLDVVSRPLTAADIDYVMELYGRRGPRPRNVSIPAGQSAEAVFDLLGKQ